MWGSSPGRCPCLSPRFKLQELPLQLYYPNHIFTWASSGVTPGRKPWAGPGDPRRSEELLSHAGLRTHTFSLNVSS